MKLKQLFLLTLTATALCFGVGCSAQPEETREQWAQHIDTTEAALGGTIAQANTLIESISSSEEALDALRVINPTAAVRAEMIILRGTEVLAQLNSKKVALAKELEVSRLRLASIPENATSAQINTTMIGQTVASVGTVLPAPWNVVAVGVGSLITSMGGLFGILGTKKAKKEAMRADDNEYILEDLITGLEDIKRASPEFSEVFGKHAVPIRDKLEKRTLTKVEAVRKVVGKAA